ncbi:MAG: dNTP triphosphohydrolase [Chitinophagales bacterium]|nr:dNTP triphosphohydrolase [Chitinophagales bacterium]MCZ2392253.1 dNTP triphosphohydrolase [Chitinophagales bacterium]
MDINKIYTSKRSIQYTPQLGTTARNEFQRDYDRIIFSSAFRRLQNKTQVFPLPGTVFVHNRLTHSLEVSSVGRSLGTAIGDYIIQSQKKILTEDSYEFYKYSLNSVIAAACLCHDIGNPAFGHSGEDAIARFFKKNSSRLSNYFTEKEWSDLIHFEGNANAIRVLTHQQKGKSSGGLLLTYSTMASIAKYPCESIAKDSKILHRKKFGFFQAEKNIFSDIADSSYMPLQSENPLIYLRHPFVWLVEAADDICYNIIDLEDAHRLGIIAHHDCLNVLMNLTASLEPTAIDKTQAQIKSISNKNDRISYLRAKIIHYLSSKSAEIFIDYQSDIFAGKHEKALMDIISEQHSPMKEIETFSIENIYNHRSVVEIENAGYNVIYELLSHFIFPIILNKEERDQCESKAIKLIPSQFLYENEGIYQKVLGVIDFISGMTDNYAVDLFKKIKGAEIGMSI